MKFNLEEIHKTYFSEPFTVNEHEFPYSAAGKYSVTTVKGDSLYHNKPNIYGRAIFLPIQFWKNNQLFLTIKCCTIKISSKKEIIRTPMSERQNTVKEQFYTGDYVFTINGVLIGKDMSFPDEKILKLREIYETTEEIEMHNALTGLFMDKSRRVVVTNLDFPDMPGKGKDRHRAFALTCESDFVDELIIKDEPICDTDYYEQLKNR